MCWRGMEDLRSADRSVIARCAAAAAAGRTGTFGLSGEYVRLSLDALHEHDGGVLYAGGSVEELKWRRARDVNKSWAGCGQTARWALGALRRSLAGAGVSRRLGLEHCARGLFSHGRTPSTVIPEQSEHSSASSYGVFSSNGARMHA